jgi:hypothetical protein
MKQTKRFILIIVIIAFALSSEAQVRLIIVVPGSGIVTLKNFGDSEVDISSHRLCHSFKYAVISSLTIISGNPSALAAGDVLVVAIIDEPLNAIDSDLGFYLPDGAFSDPDNMLDFMQYGSSGNGRESVAVEKGIWEAGTFISNPGPFAFISDNPSDFGVEFWVNNPTGLNELDLVKDISTYPNPVVNELNIVSDNSFVESIQVFNTAGKLVLSEDFNSSQKSIKMDLSFLDNGNYILNLTTDKGIVTKRVSLIK